MYLIDYLTLILTQSFFFFLFLLVESNDILYKGDPAYQQEVQDVIDSLLKIILDNLDELDKSVDASSKKLRARLALDLFHHTIIFSQLNVKSCALAAKMFKIAKSNQATTEAAARCLKYLSTLPDNTDEDGESMIAQLKEACN